MFKRIALLMRSTSFFAGFIRRTFGLFWKFGLWSLSVIKASVFSFVSFLLNTVFYNRFADFVDFSVQVFIHFFVCRCDCIVQKFVVLFFRELVNV